MNTTDLGTRVVLKAVVGVYGRASALALASVIVAPALCGCSSKTGAESQVAQLQQPAGAEAAPTTLPAQPAAKSNEPRSDVALAGSREPAAPAAAVPSTGGGARSLIVADVRPGAAVATVNGLAIPTTELLEPLLEAHGLNMLVDVVQRDLAKQGCDNDNPKIVVTAADFRAERQRTEGLMFQEADSHIDEEIDRARKRKNGDQDIKRLNEEREAEHQQLLNQFYEQRRITPVDFDLMIQTNTYLRKLAAQKVDTTAKIDDDLLHKEFAARYGEMVRVRHIEFQRPQDYVQIQNALNAGEKFEDVARKFSSNPQTRALGGQLPPFNRTDTRIPAVFREKAFQLKVGQVSDLVSSENVFHVIKLEERIMPKAVKFEAERDILYRDIREQLIQTVVANLRENIAAVARKTLNINDPMMAKQFADRLRERDAAIKGREDAEKEMAKEGDRRRLLMQQYIAQTRPTTLPAATIPAATQPSAPPAGPASLPANVPTVPSAPATRPAAQGPARAATVARSAAQPQARP